MDHFEDFLSENQRLYVILRKLLCYTASVMKIEENPDEICQNSMEADSASYAAGTAVSLQHKVRWRIPRNSAYAEIMCKAKECQ